ncbi:hypothetical protein BV25DRAFT_718124 [Artomyces pyxidatus]|uniref:Uncharacterized protein n=1 Tax=Artomyces pyxidatus TaxID=48021 RepID=A0ACB8T1Q7_9AGAM|nr:hypothetical protein BV25DRAFT_718124 [Artomyces pyxidatus]
MAEKLLEIQNSADLLMPPGTEANHILWYKCQNKYVIPAHKSEARGMTLHGVSVACVGLFFILAQPITVPPTVVHIQYAALILALGIERIVISQMQWWERATLRAVRPWGIEPASSGERYLGLFRRLHYPMLDHLAQILPPGRSIPRRLHLSTHRLTMFVYMVVTALPVWRPQSEFSTPFTHVARAACYSLCRKYPNLSSDCCEWSPRRLLRHSRSVWTCLVAT